MSGSTPGTRYRTHCLRSGRFSAAGQIYLITTVTKNREPIFENFRYGRCVVASLQSAQKSTDTLSFVVMPDHLHWLMQLRQGYSLSTSIAFVKSSSARSINKIRKTNGPMWGKGYYDRAVRKEDDLLACARYIVANPLRAGLVKRIGDYPLWDAAWL